MTVRYTPGATQLAFEVHPGDEPTLVVVPGWVSHLTYDWETTSLRSWYQHLAGRLQLLRYDLRGAGLSERTADPDAFTIDTRVDDLARVLDCAGIERAVLFGWSGGGSIALAFAARYPQRVARVMTFGTHARLLAAPDYPIGIDPAYAAAVRDLIRSRWAEGSQFLSERFLPEANVEQKRWFTAYQQVVYSPQAAAESSFANWTLDIRSFLPQVHCPALVLHRRHDHRIPLVFGQFVASHLPDARLVTLEGEHHLPYWGDASEMYAAVAAFIAPLIGPQGQRPAAELTERERQVLTLVAGGETSKAVAARLVISPATVERHVSNIYRKIGARGRADATAYAVRHGLTEEPPR